MDSETFLLAEQAVVLVFDYPVALADRRLQTASVKNHDAPTHGFAHTVSSVPKILKAALYGIQYHAPLLTL